MIQYQSNFVEANFSTLLRYLHTHGADFYAKVGLSPVKKCMQCFYLTFFQDVNGWTPAAHLIALGLVHLIPGVDKSVEGVKQLISLRDGAGISAVHAMMRFAVLLPWSKMKFQKKK